MNAAELLVRCLGNEGVDYVFGIPGEENIHIMDALAQSRIRFVNTHCTLVHRCWPGPGIFRCSGSHPREVS